jgi:hypothetical protein
VNGPDPTLPIGPEFDGIFSPSFRQFSASLLAHDMVARPFPAEALQHPWLVQHAGTTSAAAVFFNATLAPDNSEHSRMRAISLAAKMARMG